MMGIDKDLINKPCPNLKLCDYPLPACDRSYAKYCLHLHNPTRYNYGPFIILLCTAVIILCTWISCAKAEITLETDNETTCVWGFYTTENGPVKDAVLVITEMFCSGTPEEIIATTVTDENGFYHITNLARGFYKIEPSDNSTPEFTIMHMKTANWIKKGE